uniref:Peptidase M43 pregnancy-associated plasma-A domain-containing protein n=1 Tax=Bionectria ochroleuca TaxID=29856 RepID=A0A8H7K9M0_BIOOC
MLLYRSLVFAALPFMAVASYLPQTLQERSSDSECGIKGTPSSLVKVIEQQRDGAVSSQSLEGRAAEIQVTAYFHIAVFANSTEDTASNEYVKAQFELLKDTYALYGITLSLGGIAREVNDTIAVLSVWNLDESENEILSSSPETEDYWKRTRTGSYETLHIYYYEDLIGTAAFCNFAKPDRPKSDYFLDGCHLRKNVLLGEQNAPYRAYGTSLIHEVGHWFGLFHVFAGGCEGEGDYIDDTPAQKVTSADGTCPLGTKDTCPDLPGTDMVNNYMDYTADPCRDTFTPGQKTRMHDVFWAVRSGK